MSVGSSHSPKVIPFAYFDALRRQKQGQPPVRYDNAWQRLLRPVKCDYELNPKEN